MSAISEEGGLTERRWKDFLLHVGPYECANPIKIVVAGGTACQGARDWFGGGMPDPKLLETFPNPAPQRDYVIAHTHHEFTSLCPMTGHPDFANITIRYTPEKTCVELKSLKIYFHAFRNEGIFFEAVTNKICDDLGAALSPRKLEIVADWKARGGFTSVVTATWTPSAARAAGKKAAASARKRR